MKSGQDLTETRSAEELVAEAVELAKTADYVIFVGGLNKSAQQDCEDSDRQSLELPYDQDTLIEALAAANPRLVVVNISGNAVAMPWVDRVPAVLQTWYLGTEAGNALASVLVGDVNPSGHLPFTFPAKLEDVGAHALGEYPGVPRQDGSGLVDERYNESIFVGYRWADRQKKVKPLFAFGHGLSYTAFEYGKVRIDRKEMKADETITLTVPVTNVGQRAGAEVVQLYIRDVKSTLPRPVKELKGFRKIMLAPGETQEVSFVIDSESLRYYHDGQQKWVAEPGKFEAVVAASATDIRGKASFMLME